MAAQRLYGKFIGAAFAVGPLLTAGIVCAGPAHADETTYLNRLHAVGIQDLDGGDPALVQTGWKICQQIAWGAPPSQLQSLALQKSTMDLGPRGLTPRQADALIDYAIVDLCPRA
ncbi:DUF732 domain-containing protein [Mycobacterium terramassiliense]|uniref:DUF732 domain-containing protein n=1 Tax=Mycobacterium terramassiliense TaxID=1841859 RepID=A0A2U3NCP1_9MYCO|nr:DUF732 domain-containing protein [Mycobacterium terramassiliense]SPM29276.1 hypothetical protein MTAB308_2768 [Mycobacterium terramassiliense]